MRRTLDQALVDLRQALESWVGSGGRPDVRIFVYPPEWEPRMLARFPQFAAECAAAAPLELVDVGQGFLAEVQRRKGFIERLAPIETQAPARVLHDLGEIALRYVTRLLAAPPDSPAVARLVVNTGALGTFASYSAITNAVHGDSTGGRIAVPTVLAFPGEGDERELNLLRLRADTNYRVPRI